MATHLELFCQSSAVIEYPSKILFMEHLCSESMNAAWQVIPSNNEQQSSLAGSEIQVCLSVKPQSKSLT